MTTRGDYNIITSDALINRPNIGNRLIGHIFTISVIGFKQIFSKSLSNVIDNIEIKRKIEEM